MSQDILSDVLRSVRLRGAVFYFVHGGREWAAEAPPSREIAPAVMPGADHVMEYHVLTRGYCWAAIVGEKPVRMSPGDIVMFPQGDGHVMSSAPGMRAPVEVKTFFEQEARKRPFTLHLDAQAQETAAGGGVHDTTIVCGFLGCDMRPFNPLIATLPRLLHLGAAGGQDWVAQFMNQAVEESRKRRPGGSALLERMSEMMFVDAIRRYVDALPNDSSGWLAGMRDRQLGRVLAFIHEDPAAQWTVEELGRRVGLSRSALHERFVEMIGQTPVQYLTNWRMQAAASLLRNSNATVASIAQDVGYDSEAAFARAFKRSAGKPPAAWRRQAGAEPSAVVAGKPAAETKR